jgi:hypothetical protein
MASPLEKGNKNLRSELFEFLARMFHMSELSSPHLHSEGWNFLFELPVIVHT